MATTKVSEKTVKKVVEVEEKVKAFTLELSEQEAEVLLMLTGSIFGGTAPREIADKIYSSLIAANIRHDLRANWDFVNSEFKRVF